MANFVSAVQFLPLSVGDALQVLAFCALAVGFLVLFKPLLRGLALAAVLVVKPKLTKEQRLQRRQMRDAALLKRMMNSQKASPAKQPNCKPSLRAHKLLYVKTGDVPLF